jgi:RNA polymerase sigma-70 factor (sigma-E family)
VTAVRLVQSGYVPEDEPSAASVAHSSRVTSGRVVLGAGRQRRATESEFTDFYEAHAERIVRTVSLVVRDAALAEDAVAEAFARAWARWGKVRFYDRPAAWVTRVALNECNSRFRRRRVERRKAQALARPDHTDAPEPAASHVWAAVADLPLQERTLIALRYVADLPQAQIAEVMGVPPGTVASGLNRSRRRLGIALGPDRDEETA